MTAEPGDSEEGKSVPVPTRNDIKKMKVMELLSTLQARGMMENELKAVLVSRSEDAAKKNVPLMQNRAPEVIEHSAGGEFADGAQWKKLDPEAEVIYEELNMYG